MIRPPLPNATIGGELLTSLYDGPAGMVSSVWAALSKG